MKDMVPRETLEELLAAEHRLSDSYVRIRKLIGAMDPLEIPSPPDLFAYVEQKAAEVAADAARWRASVGGADKP